MSSLLLFLQLLLSAVGAEDIGIVQMSGQTCLDGVDVDPAQIIPLGKLLSGQGLSLCLFCQLVDPGDHLIHVHMKTSHIAVDDHGYTALFRLAIDCLKPDLSQTPNRDLCAFVYRTVWLFAW